MAASSARKKIRREEVVRAAITVLDEVGLEGLTMRLVATELGVQLNTVYWHSSSKPELLELMADALLAGCTDEPLPADWQERLLVLLRRYRDALLVHRDGAKVVAGTYAVMTNTLALSEAFMRTFLDAGFGDRTASWATWHSSYLVLGSVLEQQNEPAGWGQRLRDEVSPEQHPLVSRMSGHHSAATHEERFAFSCELLLRGLRSKLADDRVHDEAAPS